MEEKRLPLRDQNRQISPAKKCEQRRQRERRWRRRVLGSRPLPQLLVLDFYTGWSLGQTETNCSAQQATALEQSDSIPQNDFLFSVTCSHGGRGGVCGL